MPKGVYKRIKPPHNKGVKMKYCKQGHLMEETAKVHSNGTRYCGKCQRRRQRNFYFKDNIKSLDNAIKYLNKSNK